MTEHQGTASGGPLPHDQSAHRIARRTLAKWPWILGFAVVLAVVVYPIDASRTKQYEATTTVELSEIDLASVLLGQNLQQLGQDASRKAATTARLIGLPVVRARVSQAVGGRVSPAQIKDMTTVRTGADTSLVDVVVRSSSPTMAEQVANQTRMAFIDLRTSTTRAQFAEAQRQISSQLARLTDAQRNGSPGQILADRLAQIGALEAVSNGGVQTAQAATLPTSSVSPKPLRDALLAFVLGALLAALLVGLRARFDERIRHSDEFEELWDLPLLGVVPEARSLRGIGAQIPDGAVLEAFALARTNLRYLNVGGEVRVVVITSAVEGEGKSTSTWNLAVAAALAGVRVLVIEADLRRPVLADRLGLPRAPGFSEVLAGLSGLSATVQGVSVMNATGHAQTTVDVIVGGQIPPNPIALLEGTMLAASLSATRREYDLVLVDTPPATTVADAKTIVLNCDGIIVVSRPGRVTRTAFRRVRDLLDGLGTPVLGVLANGDPAPLNDYAYKYSSYLASTSQKPFSKTR